MFINLPCKVQILSDSSLLAVLLYLRDGPLDITSEVPCINLQGLLLRAFRGVSPITFRRFLHTIDILVQPTAYPYLLEVVPPLMVVQAVDGEYLPALDVCQAEDGRNVIIPVLEL